jgi:DNA polymerase I-like protein with 3'-5' exonuclease and polymerase domains
MAAIEAVLIAYYSDDPVLYDILTTGQSIHCYNTAKVFFPHLGLEPHEVKKKAARERRISKEIGFALFYNAGAGRIKASFEKYGEYPSEAQCKQMLENFRSNYGVAYRYAQGVVRAFERGEVLTNLVGRPLVIENKDDAYMKGFNKLIQSSASDLVVMAADKASRHWEDCKLVALVHDAIIAEAGEDYAQEAADILVDAMTSFGLTTSNGPIILQAEGAISTEWSK